MGEGKKKKIKVSDKRKFDSEGKLREGYQEEKAEEDSDKSESTESETQEQSEAAGAEVEDEKQPDSEPSSEEFPEVNFTSFILGYGTQAMMAMGLILDPTTGEKKVNLSLARHIIDIITMLREKTKGNLEASEITTPDNILFELRMQFVEISKERK